MTGYWLSFYVLGQVLYFLSFLAIFYFLALPVDWVDEPTKADADSTPEEPPYIVMAYPVLREDVGTMVSTLIALNAMDYPRSRYRVIAIPNSDDIETVATLRELQGSFAFLEIMEVPPTSAPSWDVVWRAWAGNPKAYWFHEGGTRQDQELPTQAGYR